MPVYNSDVAAIFQEVADLVAEGQDLTELEGIGRGGRVDRPSRQTARRVRRDPGLV